MPVPHRSSDARDFAAAIRFYPVAGLVVGIAVAVAGSLGALVDPWGGALFGVAAWAAIAGALHLDGLGDLADAADRFRADPRQPCRALPPVAEQAVDEAARDVAGIINQRVAQRADDVFFLAAGLPMTLKTTVGERETGLTARRGSP